MRRWRGHGRTGWPTRFQGCRPVGSGGGGCHATVGLGASLSAAGRARRGQGEWQPRNQPAGPTCHPGSCRAASGPRLRPGARSSSLCLGPHPWKGLAVGEGALRAGPGPGSPWQQQLGPSHSVSPFQPAALGLVPLGTELKAVTVALASRHPTHQGHPVPSPSSWAPNRLSPSARRPPTTTVTEVSFVRLWNAWTPPPPPVSTARSGWVKPGEGRARPVLLSWSLPGPAQGPPSHVCGGGGWGEGR